ncbi:MAG: DUF6178 family protein [Syntrophales bacterium]|nr:DUF6178 family protein [Syntrophales bacterium]
MSNIPAYPEKLIREWLPQPGSLILKSLLEQKDPGQIVQNLSSEDFFWLVKAVGDNDCLPVLELASEEQWEYLLDLEIWEKDRINPTRTLEWLKRIALADSERLSKWLLEGGRDVFSFCLFRLAEIIMREEEDETDAPPGYATIDGVFFFKAHTLDDQVTIEKLLKLIAAEDFSAYQNLMQELSSLIPAEAEEELYRQRNVRISEHGFVPYEEALAVYSPLPLEELAKNENPLPPGGVVITDEKLPVPATPIMLLNQNNILVQIISRTEDHIFRDRLRLEYAALSNKILAAGAFEEISDREILTEAWMRTGNYTHLALNYLYGHNLKAAEQILRHHQLETVFRVGWGLAIRLRDKARKWVASSWFHACGKGNDFWGSPWEEMLTGLLAARPAYFDGVKYRDFTTPEDIIKAENFIEQLRLLDLILRRLHAPKWGEGPLPEEIETFHPLFFNFWARYVLQEELSIKPLEKKKAIRFFRLLRAEEKNPPYRMEKYREVFVQDFMAGAKDLSADEQQRLKDTLLKIWEDFVQIYENVKEEDLDRRFSPYVLLD